MSPSPLFSRLSSSCFAFSGAAVLSLTAFASTQAQSPTFNVAEYAEYNAKIDDAAASFAADVARRSGAAPVRDVDRSTPTSKRVQNRSTRQDATNIPVSTTRQSADASTPANVRPTDASKSQAARIWEAFLFGTPNRSVSKPKFAFAQRDDASSIRVSRSTPSAQLSQTPQTAQTTRPLQPLQTAQTDVSASDAELAAARRRRLQELNALLATRRPEEFSRRLVLKNAASALPEQTVASGDADNNEYTENAESFAADAPALPFLLAKPTADRSDAVLQDRAEFVRESADAPFDAARANRSKIRQASHFAPTQPLELADDGFASFLLPTRPNALRLSPNVFLSTDLVRLPTAAPLVEANENSQTALTTQTPQPPQTTSNAEPSQSTPTPRPVQPLPTAQTPATVATPLPAEPSTDVPTLRPTARFVEPRHLPTSR